MSNTPQVAKGNAPGINMRCGEIAIYDRVVVMRKEAQTIRDEMLSLVGASLPEQQAAEQRWIGGSSQLDRRNLTAGPEYSGTIRRINTLLQACATFEQEVREA